MVQPNQDSQTRKFNPWSLLAVFLVVGVVVGAFFIKGGGGGTDAPPSIKIGSVLLKGQMTLNDLGVSFHYVDSDTALADFYDVSKCQGTDIKKAGFFTYSPGGESGMQKEGWYGYPKEWGSANQIADPAAFQVKRGRPFILVFYRSNFPNEITNTCFKGAGSLSKDGPALADGTNGWALVAAHKDKLGEFLGPAKQCVKSVWGVNGVGTLDILIPYVNVPLSQIESHTLGVSKVLWINLSCEEVAGGGAAAAPAGGGGDDLSSLPELERIQMASGEAFCWLVSVDKDPLNVKKDDAVARQKIMEFTTKYGFVVDEKTGDIKNLSANISEGDFYKGKFVELVQQCASHYIKDGKLNEDFGKPVEADKELPEVAVSSSAAGLKAVVEAGESDVSVLGFTLKAGENLELDEIRINVGGTGNLNNISSAALKEGVAAIGKTSIVGKVIVVDLDGYSLNVDQAKNLTLAVYVKSSAEVGETFQFSLASGADVKFTDNVEVTGVFPISNTITIAADPAAAAVVAQPAALTDADKVAMKPVLSQEAYGENGLSVMLKWTIPQAKAGRSLKQYLLKESRLVPVAAGQKKEDYGSEVISLGKNEKKADIPNDGLLYYVKVCAVYDNGVGAEEEYCSEEYLLGDVAGVESPVTKKKFPPKKKPQAVDDVQREVPQNLVVTRGALEGVDIWDSVFLDWSVPSGETPISYTVRYYNGADKGSYEEGGVPITYKEANFNDSVGLAEDLLNNKGPSDVQVGSLEREWYFAVQANYADGTSGDYTNDVKYTIQ